MTDYVIYTTSKFHCPWCFKAKELLEMNAHDYEEKDINADALYKLEFVAENHKTVPQVYYKGNLIGGYEKLSNFLRAEAEAGR